MKLQCLICKSESFIKAGFTKQNKQRYPGGEADFEYDTYGNLIKDRNKKIDKIRYNHLNLPKKITFENNDVIEYLYDANGTKLKKTVTAGTTITETQYLDGFQYEKPAGGGDWGMSFFPTAEGYVNVTHGALSPSYNYVYNYTDHLGNIRLRYTKNPAITGPPLKILEEDHYYPFGLKHNGYNGEHSVFEPGEPGGEPVVIVHVTPLTVDLYKYKFNGMEWQSELDLNYYDFGMRNYDPALGRWMNVDPLAEISRRWSPYTYAYNNPIYFIDPDGMTSIPAAVTWAPTESFIVTTFDKNDNALDTKIVNSLDGVGYDRDGNIFTDGGASLASGDNGGELNSGGSDNTNDNLSPEEQSMQIKPPAIMIFRDLTQDQLNNFRIIPEDDGKLTTPENNVLYSGDGFYFNPCEVNSPEGSYWYKVSAGAFASISYSNNEYNIVGMPNWDLKGLMWLLGQPYIVDFVSKSNHHAFHKENPFNEYFENE